MAPNDPTTEAQATQTTQATHSTLRGLLYVGLLALVFSLVRAGIHRAFIPHWWTQW